VAAVSAAAPTLVSQKKKLSSNVDCPKKTLSFFSLSSALVNE
jgi:hypothetical protein